jgi:hypothetical protein
LLGVQAVLANAQALGFQAHFAHSSWLWSLDTDGTERVVASDVAAHTCERSTMDRINVIGPEFPQMNANSMAYISAKQRLRSGFRCYYTGLGYAETDHNRAVNRIEALKAPYIVFPSNDISPTKVNAFNMVLNSVRRKIIDSGKYTLTGQIGDYSIFEREK